MWSEHPAWAWWNVTRPMRWATWGAVGGWWGYGSSYQPVYYDYGETVVYEGDTVYVDGEPVASTEDYAQQAMDLAAYGAQTIDTAVQQQTADQIEWLPLGVYALTHEQEGEPTMFLQLAVSKEGTIGGTFYNALTNENLAVEGAVDRASQRAAMIVAGRPETVLEVGIANLTQDETTALVHFGPDRTETVILVRMPESQQPQGQ